MAESFYIFRADFLYKTFDNSEWTRLPSPTGDSRHNCYGIWIDSSGMTLMQKKPHLQSRCRVKLILRAPVMEAEDDRLPILTAECVETSIPSFEPFLLCRDRARAIKEAKTMPLATLDRKISAVKLRNLSNLKSHGRPNTVNHVVRERILNLIECAYQAYMACMADTKIQTNGRESMIRAPHPPKSSNGSSNVFPSTPSSKEQISYPQAATPPMMTPTTLPQPCESLSNIPSDTPRPEEQLSIPQETTTTPTTMATPQPSSSLSKVPPDTPKSEEQPSPPQQTTTTPTKSPTTSLQPCNSSSNVRPATPMSEEESSTPSETTPIMTPTSSPQSRSSSSNIPPPNSPNAEQQSSAPRATAAPTPSPPPSSGSSSSSSDIHVELHERLVDYWVGARENEYWLRRRLEGERRAMLDALTAALDRYWEVAVAVAVAERVPNLWESTRESEYGLRWRMESEMRRILAALTAALDGEWERKVAFEVEGHRARAVFAMERMVAGAGVDVGLEYYWDGEW